MSFISQFSQCIKYLEELDSSISKLVSFIEREKDSLTSSQKVTLLEYEAYFCEEIQKIFEWLKIE